MSYSKRCPLLVCGKNQVSLIERCAIFRTHYIATSPLLSRSSMIPLKLHNDKHDLWCQVEKKDAGQFVPSAAHMIS